MFGGYDVVMKVAGILHLFGEPTVPYIYEERGVSANMH